MFDLSTAGIKAFRDHITHGMPASSPFDGTSVAAGMLIMAMAAREDPKLAERMVALAIPAPDDVIKAAVEVVDEGLRYGEQLQSIIQGMS